MGFGALKDTAKKQLKGNWPVAIGAVVISTGINLLILGIFIVLVGNQLVTNESSTMMETVVRQLLQVVIGVFTGLFAIGMAAIILDIAKGNKGKIDDILYGFKHKISQFLILNLIMRMVGLILNLTGLFSLEQGNTMYQLVRLAVWIIWFVITLRLTMAKYLMIDHPKMGALEALKESNRLMTGHCWKLFLLPFSFFFWILAVVFTLGLAGFYVMPLIYTTVAVFYIELLEKPTQEGA